MAAFLISDASFQLRVTIATAISATLPVLYILLFALRWVQAHLQRSRAYPELQQRLQQERTTVQHEQAIRAEFEAKVALTIGAPFVPAAKLIKRGHSMKILLRAGTRAGLKVNDTLLLIDPWRAIARAQVDVAESTTAEAVLTWFADPVAQGWFVDAVNPLGVSIPTDTRVVSEAAVRKRLQELENLLLEEEAPHD